MRERPILFSDAMVRAILAGTKTQTRRVVRRNDVVLGPSRGMHLGQGESAWHIGRGRYSISGTGAPPEFVKRGPYGEPGDQLWVREAWRPAIAHRHGEDACDCADVTVTYRADASAVFFADGSVPDAWEMPKAAARGNVPGIHMPRWASRLTLRVTSVRVERLLSISEEDARAEGVQPHEYAYCAEDARYRMSFARLWDSINGERAGCAWKANPWVWVVRFEVGRG